MLTADVLELGEWLKKIKNSQKFSRVQIDFVDGKYATNTTIRPVDCDLVPYWPLRFDAHLMVTEGNILPFSQTAQQMGFARIIAQVESISHPEDFRGLALDVHSPVAAIANYLADLEVVVVMAVEPGFGGQEFVDQALQNVDLLVSIRREKNLNFEICVDGGVGKEHLPSLKERGVDSVAVGVKRALEW